MNKILITGVAGFIGFSLTKKILKKKNIKVIGLDNLNSYYSKRLKNRRLDILKKSNLLRNIAYIYTGTELSKTVAYLSKKIKIDWHSIKSVKICENKDYFKKHLIKNKFTFPKGISFKNLRDFKLKEKSIRKFKRGLPLTIG